MMSTLAIGPRIFRVTALEDGDYRIEMEKYPTDLMDYAEEGGDIEEFEPKIDDLIERLHELGLIHGDLHARNIVVNPETGVVRLIDFEHTQYLDEINYEEVSAFWGEDPPFTTEDQFLQHEYEMYHFGI